MLIFRRATKSVCPPVTGQSMLSDDEGAISIEFALLLPILLAILGGSVEISRALDFSRKAEGVARSIADLVSQGDSQDVMSKALMDDLVSSSKLIVNPFGASGMSVVVSSLGVDTQKSGTTPIVCSSYATGSKSSRPVGKAAGLTVPEGYRIDKSRYLYVELEMPFVPVFGATIFGTLGVFKEGFTYKVNTAWTVRGGKTYNDSVFREIILPDGKQCAK